MVKEAAHAAAMSREGVSMVVQQGRGVRRMHCYRVSGVDVGPIRGQAVAGGCT